MLRTKSPFHLGAGRKKHDKACSSAAAAWCLLLTLAHKPHHRCCGGGGSCSAAKLSSAAPPGNKSSRAQRRLAALHFLHLMTSSWSEQEVALWLQEQGFGEFEEAFVSNKIDGRAIVNLSKEDLEDLGVKLIGRRAALVAAIVECFGKCAANKVEAAPAAAWTAADDYLANERIKLFIGGLTDSISKDMLQQELQQFAPVDEVIILLNPGTGTSKGSGFAFVVGKKNAEALMYVLPPLTPSPVLCRCVL